MSDRDDRAVVIVERSEGGFAGFLLGIAVGAGLGLLFAPRAGEETRRQLANQGRRLRAAATEKAEDLQELVESGYDRTRSRLEDALDDARESIVEKRDNAKDAVKAGRAAVRSARTELERRLAESKAARTATRAGAVEESTDDDE